MILEKTFDAVKSKNELAFIAYLTAGFPTMEGFAQSLQETADNGADIIEIGLPFSDPIADGPTIQDSSYVGLMQGATLKAVLDSVQSLKIEVPLVLMSYLNPLLAYGEDLLSDLKNNGFSGLIIPDLPVEEAHKWIEKTKDAEIDLILLVSPCSDSERIQKIASLSQGFIYCVSTTGTTGVRSEMDQSLYDLLMTIRNCTDKPVAVGFGISAAKHIQSLQGKCDGVIMGSRIVQTIKNNEKLPSFIQEMKQATKSNQGAET